MLKFEEQLEEIKQNHKIISYAIPTSVQDQEEEDAHKWWTSHKCFIEKNNWAPDLEIGCLYPNINLTSTSIGSVINVVCPFCGDSKDVSDYETW